MDLIQLGKISGYLEMFRQMNTFSNHACTYCFNHIIHTGSAVTSLKKYFQPNTNYSIALENLDNWENELLEMLGKWCFEAFADQSKVNHDWLKTKKQECMQGLMDAVKGFFDGREVKVYKVHISSNDENALNPHYDSYWDDFAFEVEGQLFLLHFGVSEQLAV